jgi:hypothetical protein
VREDRARVGHGIDRECELNLEVADPVRDAFEKAPAPGGAAKFAVRGPIPAYRVEGCRVNLAKPRRRTDGEDCRDHEGIVQAGWLPSGDCHKRAYPQRPVFRASC